MKEIGNKECQPLKTHLLRGSKIEETGCEVICGAPTTPAVMGLVKVQVKSSKQSGETGSKPGPMVLI